MLRINPLFRISRVFAPPGQATRLLPLYAFFAAIEETCSICLDETVALRKLCWWREEWLALAERGSDHPIFRELIRQGLRDDLGAEHLEAVFACAEQRLDTKPTSTLEDLEQLCEAVGRPLLELESRVTSGQAVCEPAAEDYAVSNGLAQLLRENQRLPAEAAWRWLPLTSLARHGLTRAELAADPDAPVARSLFADLLTEFNARRASPQRQDRDRRQSDLGSRHLHVYGALQAQGLRQLSGVRPSRYGSELARVGLPQLYRAWRKARDVSRL